MDKQKYDKWLRNFEVIKLQVGMLCHHRALFIDVQNIIQKNPKIQLESAFWDFLTTSYVSHTTVIVRRLVKDQKDSISFVGLLKDMAANPTAMTVETYKKLYAGSLVEYRAASDFAKFADETEEKLSEAMIRKDLALLVNASEKIEDFVDKRIAHHDRRDLAHTPTFNELHSCVDIIDKMTCKYLLLLCGASSDTMTPTIQGHWQQIFYEPWIEKAD